MNMREELLGMEVCSILLTYEPNFKPGHKLSFNICDWRFKVSILKAESETTYGVFLQKLQQIIVRKDDRVQSLTHFCSVLSNSVVSVAQ